MAIDYTEEQLNTVDKSLLITMLLNMQEQNKSLSKEVHDLNDKMQHILEQLALANDHRFGRSSEKMSDAGQICFMEVDGKSVFFNEAEAVSDLEDSSTEEESCVKKKKQSGKKEHDMSGLPITTIPHYMSEEELINEFGANGWKQLPDSIARRYLYIPAKIGVEEHHIGVYASKSDGHMVKAKHPKGLLHGSPVSESIWKHMVFKDIIGHRFVNRPSKIKFFSLFANLRHGVSGNTAA